MKGRGAPLQVECAKRSLCSQLLAERSASASKLSSDTVPGQQHGHSSPRELRKLARVPLTQPWHLTGSTGSRSRMFILSRSSGLMFQSPPLWLLPLPGLLQTHHHGPYTLMYIPVNAHGYPQAQAHLPVQTYTFAHIHKHTLPGCLHTSPLIYSYQHIHLHIPIHNDILKTMV